MPAAESTWRNQDRLNVIFGVSGLILLASTLLLFYRDHDRPWKRIQPQAVKLDNKMTLWRQEQFETDAALREHAELREKLAAALASPLDAELLANFRGLAGEQNHSSIDSLAKNLQSKVELLAGEQVKENNEKGIKAAQTVAAKARQKLVDKLKAIVEEAKVEEEQTLGERKFANAYVDAAKARYDLGIRDNAPDLPQRMDEVQKEVAKVTKLTEEYQAQSENRRALEKVVRELTAGSDAAQKAVDDNQAALRRLETSYADKNETYFTTAFGLIPLPGKEWLNFPILDAFGTRRRIDNLWADGLEQDYNFRKVRRFDRCTTCHQLMQKSLPGQPTVAAYEFENEFEATLIADASGSTETSVIKELEAVVGLRLSDEGLIAEEDIAVKYVRPESPAAKLELVKSGAPAANVADFRKELAQFTGGASEADPIPGLLVGDSIAAINGQKVFGAGQVASVILNEIKAKKPVKLTIRRGLPHPFASHPRLDLFIGDSSPHPMGKFACTICHDGQGSATEFKWASHTPNTPGQAEQWRNEHGWFDNPHWIYPMNPARFAESSCLKCHHNVVELEASEKFPTGAANKVVHGYHLITKYGCYGCHEVNGYDGPTKRIGPDLRLEPNFFAVAQQIQHEIREPLSQMRTALDATKAGSDEAEAVKQKFATVQKVEQLASRLTDRPDEDTVRHSLKTALEEDALQAAAGAAALSPAAHRLANQLKDVEAPGSLRKAGPSLRFAKSKLDDAFFYDWVENPKNFRDNTRMPRFFGLWDHLSDHGKMTDTVAPKMEPVEIHALVSYLKGQSQNFEPLPKPSGIHTWTAEEKIARGKVQFEIRGCLACHTHKDFPDTAKFRKPDEIVQGPDLSNVGAKFAKDRNPQGPDWLYSWIKEPTRYHARTVMPNLFLNPEVDEIASKPENPDDKPKKLLFDPADDISSYLLSVAADWKQSPAATTPVDSKALLEFTIENLKEAIFEKAANDHAVRGIPADMAADFKGVEQELVVSRADYDAKKELSDAQRLRYIGRKTVAKYGCYGCHDIPGFEDAKPIGTGLADWGRKDPAKLAFEHITHYIEHGHGVAGHGHGDHAAHDAHADAAGSHGEFSEQDEKFYTESLESGHRAGFAYQKLKEPRSYDYKKTENKRYNERLRMPQFPFTAEEREAVITFVLGLVADPPNTKYAYKPDARQTAIQEGQIVLEKYNCGGCHILEAERWQLSYPKGRFNPQSHQEEYPFLRPNVSTKTLETSAKADFRGLLHSRIDVLPALAKRDALPMVVDEEGGEPEAEDPATGARAQLDLWKPAMLGGAPFTTGIKALSIDESVVDEKYPARGGSLTRYLLPRVLKLEKLSNSNASGTEAWGWLPPPLIGEGEKVQTAWLHDFLLNPYPIRPAVFLRMPKFNMSSEEAGKLVAYFAAVDNVAYPYEYSTPRETERLQAREKEYQERIKSAEVKPKSDSRLGSAMNIVVDATYCVKCHPVADFVPGGSARARGPNLADVYRRLRPEYVRNWIAKPTKYLPYTPMPVNIPFKPGEKHLGGVKQELFHGTSVEQLDGLVDLLMNFDQFAQQNVSVTKMIPPPPTASAGEPGKSAEEPQKE